MSARALVTILRNIIYLNETSVQQNTRTQRVKHSTYDGGGGTAWVVRTLNAKPDCNAQWCGDSIQHRTTYGHIIVLRGKLQGGQASANTKALKGFCMSCQSNNGS
jgi:hypothetical protein